MKSFLATSPWQGYILEPFITAVNTTTSAGTEEYIRQFGNSIRHATGTAYTSKFTDGFGVTNPDLTVKKTVGLRVVDASIFVSLAPTFISKLSACFSLAAASLGTPPGRNLRCRRTGGSPYKNKVRDVALLDIPASSDESTCIICSLLRH